MFEPGDQLGNYEIVEQIGGGGAGVVYRAVHRLIRRQVALKVLKPELASRQDVVQRFLDEARAVNDIGHPNIIDIFDFIVDESTMPPLLYMVMELLGGCDLSTHIARCGPLRPADVVAIGVQITDALAAVHGRNILHRDLKASNIFLVDPDSAAPKVKVLDFGAAKVLGDGFGRPDLTQPGTAVGTPLYMAPEQVLDQPLDERVDIYAVGGVLYKMLVGHVPFPEASASAALVHAVKTVPTPISVARHALPEVPPALESVVMCCLEKQPSRRFSSMQQLRQALQASVAAGATVSPTPEQMRGAEAATVSVQTLSALRFGGRRRWWLFSALAVFVLAGVGLVGWGMLDSGHTSVAGRSDGETRRQGGEMASPEPAVPVMAAASEPLDRTLRDRQPPVVSEPAETIDTSVASEGVDAGPARSAKPRVPSTTDIAATHRAQRRKHHRRHRASQQRPPRVEKKPDNLKLVDPFAP